MQQTERDFEDTSIARKRIFCLLCLQLKGTSCCVGTRCIGCTADWGLMHADEEESDFVSELHFGAYPGPSDYPEGFPCLLCCPLHGLFWHQGTPAQKLLCDLQAYAFKYGACDSLSDTAALG